MEFIIFIIFIKFMVTNFIFGTLIIHLKFFQSFAFFFFKLFMKLPPEITVDSIYIYIYSLTNHELA